MTRPHHLQVVLPDKQLYEHFSLKRLTSSNEQHPAQELVIEREQCQITLVDWKERRFLASCQFTQREFQVILALLDAWPQGCSYATLLAVVTTGPEQKLQKKINTLLQAHNHQALKKVFRPLQTILRACQTRLHLLGVQVGAIYEYGYLLRSSRANYDIHCTLPSVSQQTAKENN